MPKNTEQFIVDAAALQELGERLIGRPEIALGELVKNSFDADATIARIEFGEDQIVISDNGTGISEQIFLSIGCGFSRRTRSTKGLPISSSDH